MPAPNINHKFKSQLRTAFTQQCLPTGPASARQSSQFSSNPAELEDSFNQPITNALNNSEVTPDWGAQYGDRQVGGPGHNATADNQRANRGDGPQPHVITEKAFYTEIQPSFLENGPSGGLIYLADDMDISVQETYLRVDLTQGGTAFRANCVIVKGTVSVVNQPIAGLAGRFNAVSSTGVNVYSNAATGPYIPGSGNSNFIMPTLDFEHTFLCQPLHSRTTTSQPPTGVNPVISGALADDGYTLANNNTPPDAGHAPEYGIETIEGTPLHPMSRLGLSATKSSNYLLFRNRAWESDHVVADPSTANHFNSNNYQTPLATVLNTPDTNYAMFSKRPNPLSAPPVGSGQPLNQGNGSPGDDMSWSAAQVLGDGTVISNSPGGGYDKGYNLNWVDFKFRFRTIFPQIFMDATQGSNFYSGLSSDQQLNFAPRVAVKGTYLLI